MTVLIINKDNMPLDERMYELNRRLSILIARNKTKLTIKELMYINNEIGEWIKIYRSEKK